MIETVEAPQEKASSPVVDIATATECPLCHADGFRKGKRKVLGIFPMTVFECSSCGATFRQKTATLYKLLSINDHGASIWQNYNQQMLTSREWKIIGSGGMSDAKQREADMEFWLSSIRKGTAPIQFNGARSSLILKVGETIVCTLSNITLKESRSIRVSSGSYAGPSVRVAKGLYFRVGSFGSTSRSYGKIQDIDSGALVVTSMRFVFSGRMKSADVDLSKIAAIDPFSDGIALHRSGYQKTQYFVWKSPVAKMTITVGPRQYEEPFSGLILKYLIEGAIVNRNKY